MYQCVLMWIRIEKVNFQFFFSFSFIFIHLCSVRCRCWKTKPTKSFRQKNPFSCVRLVKRQISNHFYSKINRLIGRSENIMLNRFVYRHLFVVAVVCGYNRWLLLTLMLLIISISKHIMPAFELHIQPSFHNLCRCAWK